MNSKNKKIMIILVVAVILAIAAAVGTYMYLVPQKTTIYVFNDNYKAGTVITNDILTPTQVDSKVVFAGAIVNTSTQFVTGNNKRELVDSKDNALRMDVAKGMPLMQSMLSIDGGSYIEMTMDDKKVAVTVPVTSISGVTRDLKEGSRVNIYASGYSSGGTNGTSLIFANMRVLSVDKDNDGDLRSATIEVTTEESLKLVEAATYSNIYFGLVNGSSYQAPTEDNMTYTNRQETQQEQVQIPESGDESFDNSIEGKGGGD